MDQSFPAPRHGALVLGTFIDAQTSDSALHTVSLWSSVRESRYLCFCNVHSVVALQRDSALAQAVAESDLVLPDGWPVAWLLRHCGFPGQQRVDGPDFMLDYCKLAEQRGESVYFYGSTSETLAAIRAWIDREFPRLRIAGMYSPPFRALSPEEDEAIVRRINDSGARMVFVGLGCPKQEIWMAEHRGRIQAVMAGVGAAFDYHAGTLRRAPPWMQEHGLEWCYRLYREPRRLWKRYLVSNTLFVIGAMRQLIAMRLKSSL